MSSRLEEERPKRYKRNGIEIVKEKTEKPIKNNKIKNTIKKGYVLNQTQVDLLKSTKQKKAYKNVRPGFKVK